MIGRLLVVAAVAITLAQAKAVSKPKSFIDKQKVNKTEYGSLDIISTRFGNNGTPTEECQCVVFSRCDSGDDVRTDSNNQPITCPGNSEVCCRNPRYLTSSALPSFFQESTPETNFQSSSVTPATYPDTSTSSFASGSTPTDQVFTDTNGTQCMCVQFYLCLNNSENGYGLLDFKITPCPKAEICCPLTMLGSTLPPDGTVSPVTPDIGTPTSPSGITGDIRSPTPPTPEPSPEPPYSPQCGYRNIATSYPDASATGFGEYPWMGMLLEYITLPNGTVIPNHFLCGASMISESLILTAAHCVRNKTPGTLSVRMGEYNATIISDDEPLPHQEQTVSEIIFHPNYNPQTLFNDLAILRMSVPFQYAFNIAPVCIPLLGTTFNEQNNYYNASRCIATGWGKNSSGDDGVYRTTLRKVDLTLLSRKDCQTRLRNSRYGEKFKLDLSFICAIGGQGLDTCKGDGGGPLFCELYNFPNRYVEVGVTSWGVGCNDPVPAVYATLLENINWFTSTYNSLSGAVQQYYKTAS